MIDDKVKGHKTVQVPQPQEMAPVIDIMEALKKSLSTLKKPAASELAPRTEIAEVPKPRAGKRRVG